MSKKVEETEVDFDLREKMIKEIIEFDEKKLAKFKTAIFVSHDVGQGEIKVLNDALNRYKKRGKRVYAELLVEIYISQNNKKTGQEQGALLAPYLSARDYGWSLLLRDSKFKQFWQKEEDQKKTPTLKSGGRKRNRKKRTKRKSKSKSRRKSRRKSKSKSRRKSKSKSRRRKRRKRR